MKNFLIIILSVIAIMIIVNPYKSPETDINPTIAPPFNETEFTDDPIDIIDPPPVVPKRESCSYCYGTKNCFKCSDGSCLGAPGYPCINGERHVLGVVTDCSFCHGTGDCSNCNGTGKCLYCS